MTITSSGQLVIGNITSAGEYIIGNFTLSGDVLLGSEPAIQYYPLIEYNEDTEMFQTPGTTESQPVQLRSLSTGELLAGTLTVNHVWYEINNGLVAEETEWTPSPTITSYSNNMYTHKVAIPSTLGGYTFVDGDKIRVALDCTIDGTDVCGQIMVNFRTPEATLLANINAQVDAAIADALLATSAQITALNNLSAQDVSTAISTAALATAAGLSAVNTKIDTIDTNVDGMPASVWGYTPSRTLTSGGSGGATAQEVWTYAGEEGRTITGGSATGSGSEKVIPAGSYELNSTAKTILLKSDYADTTLEQIIRIKNITRNYIIYDCNSEEYREPTISIIDSTITYTVPGTGFTNDDVIQIFVNKV